MVTVPTDSADQLGFNRIVDALAAHASSELGREAIEELEFLPDADAVRHTLAQVAGLMELIGGADGSPPLDNIDDIGLALTRASRGGTLSPEGLYQVARTVRTMARVRRYLTYHGETLAALAPLAERLPDAQLLADELASTFDAAGEIRDDASPELSAARKRLTQLRVAIKKRLEDYIHRRDIAEWLQDDYYTLREERYVIPIVSSFQGKIDGIIHGASNTGQTVFVEPSEFIEANNDLTVAAGAVEAAIYAILKERTEWIRAEVDDLQEGLRGLVHVDGLAARARFALAIEAQVPGVATAGPVRLNAARNPILLLTGVDVVANDITLDADHAFLVVTGPNTGGKTVTLNTLGLTTLMTWAGVPSPVEADSTVVLFDEVHALIGDAQDIGKHLSTFSGHVEALKRVIDAAAHGSLVLLDEIAVGTEPQQGAALAIAVLESLANRGARGLVTTHYERLKTLPFEDPRFANASVGVSPGTMEPTFELHYGEPGSSTPLEVAARLGIPASIVARAREVAGGNSGLTEALERLRQARDEARMAEANAREAKHKLDTERQRLQQQRQRLQHRADEEVRELRGDARRAIERGLKAVKEATRDLAAVREARELQRRAGTLKDVKQELRQMAEAEQETALPGPSAPTGKPDGPFDAGDLGKDALKAGVDVFVRTLGQPGTIVDVRGNNSAQVAVGGLKLTLKRKDLGVLGVPTANKPTSAKLTPESPSKKLGGRPKPRRLTDDEPMTPPPRTDDITADLRGMRVDEVEDRLVATLDHAYYDDREAIWVIHGHGTGKLKKEVRGLIRSSPYVASWRPGLRHEGGDGVTIAWLHRD